MRNAVAQALASAFVVVTAPVVDVTAQNKLRELILEAFQDYEAQAAIAS